MTDHSSNCSVTQTSSDSSVVNIINNHYPDHEPVVRYASPREEKGPKQEPILRSIHAQVPDRANWVSAIYLATERQLNRLEDHAEEPYANPASDNIAKTIQDECEDGERVLYSVHAESDAHEDDDEGDVVLLPTMVDWLEEFIQSVANVDPDVCQFYYSGNRSIHAHAPLFVTGENLRWLKEQTKQFCDRTGAELDASVYKAKQQFRLPGAVHQAHDGAFQKVNINTDWHRPEIISAAAADVAQPDTYTDVLSTIFGDQEKTDLPELLLSSSADTESSQSSSVLSTWRNRYSRYDQDKRRAHTAPEFYPYPTGDENDGRSLAAIRVLDEPFQRRAAEQLRTYIPCYFYGAHSCSGRDYTKDQHYAPLQLSQIDAKKWDYETGETLAVIGGGNYKSVTLEIVEEEAEVVGELLDPDEGDREDALDYLETSGYDVGSAGHSQSDSTNTGLQQSEESHDDGSNQSQAAKLQQRAEQGSIEASLTHDERRKVANRLLSVGGWDYAWNWFSEQYDSDFDPQRTWQGFRSVIETFSEDFASIEMPQRP